MIADRGSIYSLVIALHLPRGESRTHFCQIGKHASGNSPVHQILGMQHGDPRRRFESRSHHEIIVTYPHRVGITKVRSYHWIAKCSISHIPPITVLSLLIKQTFITRLRHTICNSAHHQTSRKQQYHSSFIFVVHN